MGLQKRYPPEPVKQNGPAPQAQSGPAQPEEKPILPEKELTKDQQALIALTPQEHKNLCLSALTGQMEKLPQDDPNYKECSFLAHSLKNGWIVDDIPLLRDIYNSLSTVSPAHKREANKILDQFTSAKTTRLSDRYEMLGITSEFLLNLGIAYPIYQKTRRKIIEHNKEKTIYPLEYPEDKDFGKIAEGRDPNKGIRYSDVFKNDDPYRAEREELARENTEYVFDEVSDLQRQPEKERPFIPNAGQLHNKMTIPASEAVGEVIGSAVYDEIEEMSRGKLPDRKVKLHRVLLPGHRSTGPRIPDAACEGRKKSDPRDDGSRIQHHAGRPDTANHPG